MVRISSRPEVATDTAPTNVTVFLALSPIAATILGALMLSETITLVFILGLILVVLGLWVAAGAAAWFTRAAMVPTASLRPMNR